MTCPSIAHSITMALTIGPLVAIGAYLFCRLFRDFCHD